MRKLPSLSKMPSQHPLSSTIELNNGILMPRIHLGVYMTSGTTTSNSVTHALSAGYRGVDSAEWYANEKEVGSAISKYIATTQGQDNVVSREDIWFTTKLKDNVSYEATRRKIKQSIEKSGLGYVDLYLLHSPYGGKERRRECWRAVEDAVAEGEVRAGGVSNFGVRHVSFLAFYPSRAVSAVQLSSPWVTKPTKIIISSRPTVTRTPRLIPKTNPLRKPNRSPPLQHAVRHNHLLPHSQHRNRSLRAARARATDATPGRRAARQQVRL